MTAGGGSGSEADPVREVYVAVRDAVADLAPTDLVLVACSGGPDSLALAAAAARLAPRGGPGAGAVVVDHGWSAASATAAQEAAGTCRALGLAPVELVAVDSGGPGGPEAAARSARYDALAAAASGHGAAAVLLGHTLDDQAETVLLGLARGSGARSLAGMPARRGTYRRPLLDLPAATTAAACAALGLEPWQDPANADPAFARVRVRGLAAQLEAALGPGITAALARTARLLREDADALDAAAAELLAVATVDQDRGGHLPAAEAGGTAGSRMIAENCMIELEVGLLAAAPDAVRRRALLAAARSAGSPGGSLSRRHALAVDALLAPGRARGVVHLPGGVSVRRECGRLRYAAPATTAPAQESGRASDRQGT